MTEHEDTPRRQVSVKRLLLLGLPILLVVLYFGWRGALKLRFHNEVAWFRAQGFPTNLEELAAWAPKPMGDNAADVYEQAFGAFPRTTYHRDLRPGLGRRLPAGKTRKAKAFLRTWDVALGFVTTAAAMPECRFPVVVKQGRFGDFGHVYRLRSAGRGLALRALLRAGDGRIDAAIDDVRTLLGMARSIERDPMRHSPYIRERLAAMAMTALEQALNLGTAGAKPLHDVAEATQEEPVKALFARAVVGQTLQTDREAQESASKMVRARYHDKFPQNLIAHRLYGFLGGSDLDRAAGLRLCRRAIQTVRDPRTPPPKVPKVLDGLIRDVPDFGVGRYYSYGLQTAWEAVASRAAWLRVMRAALAVEGCRLKHGRLPASLKDLVPEYIKAVPVDPFDGKPLRYRKLKKGFVVYSVGRNGRDDGGRNVNDKPPADDITFRVLRGTPQKGKGK